MARWRMPWHHGIGPIGLDLGGDAPRATQVRLGADVPRSDMIARIAPGASLEERAASAAQALRAANFIGREVAVGLPSPFVRTHVARLPELDEFDLREAVAWEASERAARPREEIVADSIATGAPGASGDAREERLIVSADSGELARALDHLIDAGFEPNWAEPRFTALCRALARRARRDSDVANIRAILHVDESEATVLVLRGDRVAFCRELPFGGTALDEAVAGRLGVPVESAAVLRSHRMASVRGLASPVDPAAEEAAQAAARPTLDALASELALCLRYFGVTFRGGQPARIVLSGPHAAEPRLAGIVEECCRSTVCPLEDELPPLAREALGTAAPRWIVAYGLACRPRGLPPELEDAA
jgi:Tfp pilus assembly PilM family ATPase